MQIDTSDEISRFIRILPLCIAIAAIGYCVAGKTPQPPPSNSAVFGCYTASNSPAILLDGSGMHILQENYPVIPFHLERSKRGILLTADAPIRADKTDGGYRFGMNKRGVGWFMPFYRVEKGRTYGVFDDRLLGGFQMPAMDGVDLNYEPSDSAQCA